VLATMMVGCLYAFTFAETTDNVSWKKTELYLPVDSPEIVLPYPIDDTYNPYGGGGLIDLNTPTNISDSMSYDPVSGEYNFFQTMDGINFRNPSSMTSDEFLDYSLDDIIKSNWQDFVQSSNTEDQQDNNPNPFRPTLDIESKLFNDIFGSNKIEIRPQGSAELTFGVNYSKTENPRISVRQQRNTVFDFDQKIQLNLIGNIGDKMKLQFDYNTESSFDFENQMKLEYTGKEDEIIQKIEAGNVTLPLSGSLISGSQSLFGIKAQTKWGKLTSTTILSQEKGERKEINVEGGAQTQDFEITGDDYEANRHYFLSNYFRDQYDDAMSDLPIVNSAVGVTRIEVWVTNKRAAFEENRNIVGFTDIGEDQIYWKANDIPVGQVDLSPTAFPDNENNSLYASVAGSPAIRSFSQASGTLTALGYSPSNLFEDLESARKLTTNEYSLNSRLGFISLNQSLNNDEVLAVAYEYTLNGQTYQVGEFSTDGIEPPNALMVKLLKSTITNPNNMLWDLMMKNIYSIGAYQVNKQNFRLDVWYNDPTEGFDIPFIPKEGVDQLPLINVLNLDRIDQNGNGTPDGVFDYVPNAESTGGTLNEKNGRVYFTSVEPFGSLLDSKLEAAGLSESDRNDIVFQALYDSTKVAAQQIPELNRFKLKGTYQSASSDEISLNAINVPQGSVKVTAGGVQLTENSDYTVDYNLGRVKILNSGLLESGTPIKISLESNSGLNFQTKTMVGNRFDYEVNENLLVGGTILNLSERPLTQKVDVGSEPISNTIWGADVNYSKESEFVTKLVDKLPFYGTKETSNVNFSAEFAQLLPGHSRSISKEGISYVDDFEGSYSTIDLRSWTRWSLASTPQGQDVLFPEGNLIDSLAYGFNRSHVSWYTIDNLFYGQNSSALPPNVNADMRSDHRMREVREKEVFPSKELPPGSLPTLATFDLTYYPDEKGAYNFNSNVTLNANGTIGYGIGDSPSEKWGGIMRDLTTTDFEQSNIEFIQFWMMDPFNEDSENTSGGQLYFNLGNISEDILRDSRKSFESGLPSESDQTVNIEETAWATVPTSQAIVNAFDNTTNSNADQDVGLDGRSDAKEAEFMAQYLGELPGPIADIAILDPAYDNYHHFRGTDYDDDELDILQRYKRYNGYEGNTVTASDSPENYPTQSPLGPSTEDVNQDQNLSKTESYFQYKVNLVPSQMSVGNNYITDRQVRAVTTANDETREVIWYQFKIPVRDLNRASAERIGGIQDFRSIRFMRMFMKGWSEDVTLRFARLELVRGEWRKYNGSLESVFGQPNETDPTFDISAVNLEENSNKTPINYVLPDGITRELAVGSTAATQLNEQSLALNVCDLSDGVSKAAFRNLNIDMRQYKKLKMFIHAEDATNNGNMGYGDLTVYVRLGSDFKDNYYEYEVPVYPTAWGDNQPEQVWPQENDMEIVFADLKRAKTERDFNQWPVNVPYEEIIENGTRKLTVVGNPVLSAVKTIMIGIRNPAANSNPWMASDDGQDKCAEIWVNELRLSDFDERSGWAAVARVNTQLADLGNLSVAANMSTPGFGSIEKKVNERQKEEIRGIDASSNIELGKFLPEESGIKIPLYMGYSETVSNPQFDPLSPDIETSDVSGSLTGEERRAYLRRRRDFLKRRSINLTNVRKERASGASKPHFYDISNFSASYSYSEITAYDINTEFNNTRNYHGGLTYNFAPKPKTFSPFASVGFINKSKWFKLVKDFNVNLGPKQFSFRTDVDRTYNEFQARNNSTSFNFPPQSQYTKTFNWTRVYDLKYDLTKSLRVNFSANNRAIIGEPAGIVDREDDSYADLKEEVWGNIENFGETTNYNHTFNVSYKLPLDKLPLTNWLTVNTGYAGTYDWQRAPFAQDSLLANTIQNSRNMNVNGQVNMLNLYNKVPFLKKVNKASKSKRGSRGSKGKVKKDASGDEDEEKEKEKSNFKIGHEAAKFLMMLKNINVTYTQTEGQLLPSYTPTTNVLGMDNNFSAPGFGFVFGSQDEDYPFYAARRGWISQNNNQNIAHTNIYSENLNLRANIEPIKYFRIDLTATKTQGRNNSGFFRFNEDLQDYVDDNNVETGNYSSSIISLGTTFSKDDDNNISEIFGDFINNRSVISARLANLDPNGEFRPGYGSSSQDVVIPAFIAAYTNKSPLEVNLSPLSVNPMPNWRITYDGLSKNKKIKKLFKSFTLGHAYRSTYTLSSYTSNLNFRSEGDRATDINGNFISELQIQGITISEQLSPLINVDMTWQNSLISKVELKRNRTLNLSLSNYQLTENRSNELVVGSGYRFKNVKFPFKIQGKKRPENDLNVRADLSIRDNLIITRIIVSDDEGNEVEQNQLTSGQTIFSLKTYADYTLNNQLNFRVFYDHQFNQPQLTSISFPTTNVSAGIAIRFTLAQ
jgi:cell surface protein SprA